VRTPIQAEGDSELTTGTNRERLAQRVFRATQVRCAPTEADSVLVAKKKTLFDDNPVQVNELTFIVKSDLSQPNQSIAALQVMSQQMQPKKNKADQEGKHNRNVLLLL